MESQTINIKNWAAGRIRPQEIEKYLSHGQDFIPDEGIEKMLRETGAPDWAQLRSILDKSLAIQNLSLAETAALLQVTDPEMLAAMRETALAVKKKVYDNRIVMFAPLYLGNYCVNNCLYCGFKTDNHEARRRVLTLEEIRWETEVLAGKIGHKRLIAVYGEHPKNDVDFIMESIREIYSVKVAPACSAGKPAVGGGAIKKPIASIRRVNVNASPFCVEDLKKLHTVGLGTYQVFQETYHKETYRRLHPEATIKGNYRWRLYCMHRAMEAGIDDVGIGALFGLYDWKFEVMGLVHHAWELERAMGIGPHTVSFPRLEPALNTPMAAFAKYRVSDEDFMKIILVVRLAIPYTGMILTARENPRVRKAALQLGVTQTDASTKIDIGGYSADVKDQDEAKQQFILGDTRSLDDVVRELAEMGSITSFCTAGYRCGRTGKCIMDLLRSGKEGNFCKLNAVLTFKEWLDDFASPATRSVGEKVLQTEIREIETKLPGIFPKFSEYYRRVSNGERDLYL